MLNDATGSPGCSANASRRSEPPAPSSAPVTGSNRAPGGATGTLPPTSGFSGVVVIAVLLTRWSEAG